MITNSSILTVSENIGSLIRQGLFEKATYELKPYAAASDRPWRRLYRHYQAKIKLVRGDFESACHDLTEIISEEGPHILLYADLVAGYFMAKQYAKWKLAIDDLNREFQTCQKQLQPINKWRTQIILAKSLELNGAVWEAYQVFQTLSKSANIDFRIKGLTHLVRLESQYPLTDSFNKHYLALKSFSLKNDQAEYNYDVLHSLLLAEAEHINIASAIRTISLIPREQNCYFTLAYFELLDIWLRKDPDAYTKLVSIIGTCDPSALSEEKLLLLAQKQKSPDWYTWPNEIPIAQYFRLIRFLREHLSIEDQAICLSQTKLIINGLSSQSQKIWSDFLTKDLNFSPIKDKALLQWISDQIIKIDMISIDFGRQKLVLEFLRLFSKSSPEISFQFAAEQIWKTKLDSYSYDRIRQLVKRTNSLTRKNANIDLLLIQGDQIKMRDCEWANSSC